MVHTSRFKLIVHEEGGPRAVELGPGPAVVGRAGDNAVRINHSSISRRHCEMRCSAGGVELRDLGSANGTLVNGERIERRVVRPGDRIQFGHVRAEIAAAGGAAGTEAGDAPLEEPPPGPVSDFVLVVVDGEQAGERYPLEGRRLTLGRGSANDIRIRGLGVSATHAEIVWEGETPVMRDLASTNGILRSGRRVKEAVLRSGLTLGIGKVNVRIEGPVDEIEIGVDPGAELTARPPEDDETLQFHHLAASEVPRRRKAGAVVGLVVLALALAAAAFFYLLPSSSKRLGGGLAGTVEAPGDSLLQVGFSAEEADVTELWPVESPGNGELARGRAATRSGRFGFVLERAKGQAPASPTLAVYRDRFAVDGRRRYELKAWARRASGDVDATLMVRFLNAAGEVVQERFGRRTAAGAFEEIKLSPTVPEGCTTARIGLAVGGGAGVAHFDDVVFRPSDLAPRSLTHPADRSAVELTPDGVWSLRMDRYWPLRRVEYFVAAGKARFAQAYCARPTDDGVVRENGETRFTGTLAGPGRARAPFRLAIQGSDEVVFTYDPWKGKGARREGITFAIRPQDLEEGILAAAGGEVTARTGPFSAEACDGLVIGSGTRKIRLQFEPPLDVELTTVGPEVRIALSRRHAEAEPVVVKLHVSLLDLMAGARTALDKGQEAMNRGRYGEAYRELNRVIRVFAVKKEDVDEAQRLIARVQARFRERFDAIQRRASEAEFFRDPSSLAAVLQDALELRRAYQDTPVEGEVRAVVDRLNAIRGQELKKRLGAYARRMLLLARDAKERGDVSFAEEYYRMVIEQCPGTSFAGQARAELEEVRKIRAEVEKKLRAEGERRHGM